MMEQDLAETRKIYREREAIADACVLQAENQMLAKRKKPIPRPPVLPIKFINRAPGYQQGNAVVMRGPMKGTVSQKYGEFSGPGARAARQRRKRPGNQRR